LKTNLENACTTQIIKGERGMKDVELSSI